MTQCTTSQLKISRQSSFDFGATGTLHVGYGFTNVGESACSLYGYPGFQPLGAQGQPLPENLVRTEAPGSNFNGGPSYGPPRTVDLVPGATVAFSVAFGDDTGGPPGLVIGSGVPVEGVICYSASSIEVWPPNQTEALRIAARPTFSTYCGLYPKPIIDIGPVVAVDG